jgi:hypothetical protein
MIFLAGLFAYPLAQLYSLVVLNTIMLVSLLVVRPYK